MVSPFILAPKLETSGSPPPALPYDLHKIWQCSQVPSQASPLFLSIPTSLPWPRHTEALLILFCFCISHYRASSGHLVYFYILSADESLRCMYIFIFICKLLWCKQPESKLKRSIGYMYGLVQSAERPHTDICVLWLAGDIGGLLHRLSRGVKTYRSLSANTNTQALTQFQQFWENEVLKLFILK